VPGCEVAAAASTHPTLAITRNEYGRAQTRFCEVRVIASTVGIVTQINTEDWNAGQGLAGAVRAFGGICAERLGMKPQQS
jgi:hypothetical protein